MSGLEREIQPDTFSHGVLRKCGLRTLERDRVISQIQDIQHKHLKKRCVGIIPWDLTCKYVKSPVKFFHIFFNSSRPSDAYMH